MTAGVDRRGKHWNQIDSSEVNRGNHTKLNPDQMKERARFHALRLAYSKPTLQDICDYWWTTYGIKMAYGSEKEWAWRNESLIIDTMNRLVDAGEIQLDITETSLVNTLKFSGMETAKVVQKLEEHMTTILRKCDFEFDPLKQIKVTLEEYDNADEKTKGEIGRKVRLEEDRNKFRIQALAQVSEMLAKHKKVLIDTVEATKELFDDSKMRQRKIEKEVRAAMSETNKKNLARDFNPLDVEITDDMRKEGPRKEDDSK